MGAINHNGQDSAVSGSEITEERAAVSVRILPHFLMLSASQLDGLPPTAGHVALQVLLAPPPKVAIISLLLQVAAVEDSNSGSPRTSGTLLRARGPMAWLAP